MPMDRPEDVPQAVWDAADIVYDIPTSYGNVDYYDARVLFSRAILKAREKAFEWQPIEKAPRDGTEIWACDLAINRDGTSYEQKAWRSAHGEWLMIDEQTGGPIVANPTLWQPLPAPPAIRQHSQKG